MNVTIRKPAKNAMQSGHGKGKSWVLEYETETPREAEPLMGWVSSGDTLNQVVLRFDTCDDALSFANNKGWSATVLPAQERRVKPRNYGDNFKYVPVSDKD